MRHVDKLDARTIVCPVLLEPPVQCDLAPPSLVVRNGSNRLIIYRAKYALVGDTLYLSLHRYSRNFIMLWKPW